MGKFIETPWLYNASFSMAGFCLFLIVIGFYLPGFSGGFLLDDFHTLTPLVDMHGELNFETVERYIATGDSGPLGRPISLLTFALNAQSSPQYAFPFLLTNSVIHALNALLVFLFLSLLLGGKHVKQGRFYVAGFAAIFWALHPYHVSTVLYVVQRMTLLATFFTISTLILYVVARGAYISGQQLRGCVFIILSFVSALFAILSKENAVLIPIQLMITEMLLSRTGERFDGKWGGAIKWVTGLACLFILGYLVRGLSDHIIEYIKTGVGLTFGRSFTMYERLITEPRIVGEYLLGFLIPRIQSAGVFQDNYLFSTSLFTPSETLFWIIIHPVLIALAWFKRKTFPLVFWSVSWFYGSHLLESSVIMLELKFEHRNYLPSIGLAVLIAVMFQSINNQIVRRFAQLAAVAICTFMLFFATRLWGNEVEAASVWLKENPRSERIYEQAARVFYQRGDEQKAKDLLKSEIHLFSKPAAALRYIAAFCETHDGKTPNWPPMLEAIKNGPADWRLSRTIEALYGEMVNQKCNILGLDDFLAVLNAYRSNKTYNETVSGQQIDNFEILALLYYKKNDEAMIRDRELGVDRYLSLSFVMIRAANFASAGERQYAVGRLSEAINSAKLFHTEDSYTLGAAEEMLGLIQDDLREKSE